MNYFALALILLLAGCASGQAPGHSVVVNPNCGQSAAGPQTSPPAKPYDYGDCYPDLL
jgi:hypothetical protein